MKVPLPKFDQQMYGPHTFALVPVYGVVLKLEQFTCLFVCFYFNIPAHPQHSSNFVVPLIFILNNWSD